jgi:hypothetical protein
VTVPAFWAFRKTIFAIVLPRSDDRGYYLSALRAWNCGWVFVADLRLKPRALFRGRFAAEAGSLRLNRRLRAVTVTALRAFRKTFLRYRVTPI